MNQRLSIGIAAVLLTALAITDTRAQGPNPQNAAALFKALDTNGDGKLTRNEMESAFGSWYKSWGGSSNGALTRDQIAAGLTKLLPAAPAAKPGQSNTFNINGNSTPFAAPQNAVDAMMQALPSTPGAKPQKSRKILVLAHTGAGGFVHQSIPLAAATVVALGNRGGLWTTTVSYDSADINSNNLKQYDAIFLDSTTACFLDDPDPAVTKARRAALLDFVRRGKGIAGIHAATDSYHTDCVAAENVASGRTPAANGTARIMAAQFIAAADKDNSESASEQEWQNLADEWFQKLDSSGNGAISESDFVARFRSSLPRPDPHMNLESKPVQQWPEFNKLIGGFFKFHWPDPQLIYVKIDDPNSPLTAMFHGQEFVIHDETYTFEQASFSRKNVHVLTSIDYAKMSPEDKAKEPNPRTDADYALSYIRREGKGRVFYEGHGHDQRVYAMTPMLEHIRAGIQYALGDIKADDSPSEK